MIPADTAQASLASLDRHALVLTIWLPVGLVAAALIHYGIGPGHVAAIGCAFAAILAGFVGHIVVNVVTGSAFTPRELALGLVLYLAAVVAFGLDSLLDPDAWAGRQLATSAGFVALFVAFVIYLVTARGTRGAFEGFDVIRSFRASGDGETDGRS